MEILLQVLDELDDAASALAHAAIALEARLAGVVGWAAGAAVLVAVFVGMTLGFAA
jgi:hypothetical protein